MRSNLIYLLLSLPLLFGGCSEDVSILDFPRNIDSITTSVQPTDQLKAITRYLSRNNSKYTRSNPPSVMPYLVKGDTVMFIVNHDEGWEVFSNDIRQPMVLMKSDTGFFSPPTINTGSPFDCFFHDTAAYLYQLKETDFSDVDSVNAEWKAFGVQYPQQYSAKTQTNDEEVYDWVWVASTIGTSDTFTLTPKGGRLTTQWDQKINFNLYTPFLEDVPTLHAPAGCVAIAFGQFFYHSNRYFNKPTQSPSKAVYNQASNTYSFSDFRSDLWKDMNDGDSFYNTSTSMVATAALVGWIGKEVDTKYAKLSKQGSSASVNEKVKTFFKNQTGISVSYQDFDNNACQAILTKGYPVILFSKGVNTGNHTMLADYFVRYHNIWQDFYVYKKINGDDTDIDETPDIPDEPTFEELERIFGRGNVRMETNYYNAEYYRFNWGASGTYNDISFAASFDIWSLPNGDKYSKYKMFSF